jgi:hypothetical protein
MPKKISLIVEDAPKWELNLTIDTVAYYFAGRVVLRATKLAVAS